MKIPVLVLSSAFVLSSCGSGSATNPTTTIPSTTTVAVTTPTAVTQNLTVTPSVRLGLLNAAAAFHGLPASDYTGLLAAKTYYAFDPSTDRYYAAAGLVPKPSSYKAQVGTQDDGAYNLFTRRSNTSTWTVFNDGLGGVQGAICPLVIPATVLKVWHWTAHSCYPGP